MTRIKEGVKRVRRQGALLSRSFFGRWRAGFYAALASIALLGGIFGLATRMGLGRPLEFLLGALTACLLVGLTALLSDLIVSIIRSLPKSFINAFMGCFGMLVVVLYPLVDSLLWSLAISFVIVAVQWILGVSAWYTWKTKGNRRARVFSLLVFGGALALNGWAAIWLLSPGVEEVVPTIVGDQSPEYPGRFGKYSVESFTYGSGKDKQRLEYGTQVRYVTPTVDASPFVPHLTGWKAAVRSWFWGFGKEEFPLNGRVWLPSERSVTPFPLILLVHGNHQMEEFSDPGYGYLGRFLASHGFVAVSVDQNFLNGSWSGDVGNENNARAWILLKHLEQWHTWAEDENHPLYQLVDLDNVGLVGHSRGGEAAAIAGLFNNLTYYPDDTGVTFDFGFGIQSVVAIAPSEGQYTPAGKSVELQDINYLVLQGSHDSDVSIFMGQRQYQRVGFSGNDDQYKASVYLGAANHGQFNSVWGRKDLPPPLGALLNTAPLMAAETQQELAKIYIGSFLLDTLQGQKGHRTLFSDPRFIQDWVHDLQVASQYQPGNYQVLTNFNEDVDITTMTIPNGEISGKRLANWREENLTIGSQGNLGTRAVRLDWSNLSAAYSMSFPAGQVQVEDDSYLVLHLVDGRDYFAEDSLNFTIQLVDTNGQMARLPLASFANATKPISRQLTKAKFLDRLLYYETSWQPAIESYLLPLSAFRSQNPDFSGQLLSEIHLKFDWQQAGALWLAEVGVI